MEKIIICNSDSKQDPNNYSCIVPHIKVEPHSQVCLQNFQGYLRPSVHSNQSNNTFWVFTQELLSAENMAGPHQFKLPHGSLRIDADTTNTSNIVSVLQNTLNNNTPFEPIYKNVWACSYAGNLINIKGNKRTGARASGVAYGFSNFERGINGFDMYGLTELVSGDEGSVVYDNGTDAPNQIATVESGGATDRIWISSKQVHGLVSSDADGSSNTDTGGVNWKIEIPAGNDPTLYVQGMFGVVDKANVNYFDKNANWWGDIGNEKGTAFSAPSYNWKIDALKSTNFNLYFNYGFFVDESLLIYAVQKNFDGTLVFTSTGIQLETKIGASSCHLSLRFYFDGTEPKVNFLIDYRLNANPASVQLVHSCGFATPNRNVPLHQFLCDLTEIGNTEVQIKTDFYLDNDEKANADSDPDESFTIVWQELMRGDVAKLSGDDDDKRNLQTANFQNMWAVDQLRYNESEDATYQQSATIQSVGWSTGNIENAPQTKIYLINCPTLPIESVVCNAYNGTLISTIGTYNSDYTDKQKGYENWVSLDNESEINISNINIFISDVYGKPTNDFENTTTAIIKFRRDPQHLLKSQQKTQREMILRISEQLSNKSSRLQDQLL